MEKKPYTLTDEEQFYLLASRHNLFAHATREMVTTPSKYRMALVTKVLGKEK